MEQKPLPFWLRHRRIMIAGTVALGALGVMGVTLAVLAHRFEPYVRARLVNGLAERFQTRVELDSFHVAPGNGLNGEWGIWASGKGLRIWPPRQADSGQPQQPVPMISLQEFRFHVPLYYGQNKALKIAQVKLSGLRIVVPPRQERQELTLNKHKPSPSRRDQTEAEDEAPAPPAPAENAPVKAGMLSNVIAEKIECRDTELILETNKPDKLPLSFLIARLNLTHVTAGGPMGFDAELTNPKPVGVIHSKGSLGPWMTMDPGETPVSGTYTFDHADLSTLKGIAGMLSSVGQYRGTLQNITVDGNVEVPDFRLPKLGSPEALHTRFHATVDGTDGDTWLEPVEATLGHSHFTSRGQVVRVRPPNWNPAQPVTGASLPPLADFGHQIDLKVDVDRGHIEDFLRLATHSSKPILTGSLVLTATLHIPPGKQPVHERMRLDGKFKLDQAHFTSDKVQKKILDLSLRGQGRPDDLKDTDPNSVISEMQGDFHMANGAISLPDVEYNVPGAQIRMNGVYPLEGFMHFEGTARMQATVSQMVGGWKGWLLKPADRFFRKDGAGTVVPIEIKGPHDQPEFSVDLSRLGKTSPERPGQK